MGLPPRNNPAQQQQQSNNTNKSDGKRDYGFSDKVHIVFNGRLGQDPKFFGADGGRVVMAFSIAVATGKDKDGKDTTNWTDCVIFGKRAEELQRSNVFAKGDYVCAETRNLPEKEEYPLKDNQGTGVRIKYKIDDLHMRIRAPKDNNYSAGNQAANDQQGDPNAGQPEIR